MKADIDYEFIADTCSEDLELYLRGISTTINLISQYLNSVRAMPLAVQATDEEYLSNVGEDLNNLKALSVAVSNELLKRTNLFIAGALNRSIDVEEQE